MDEIKYDAELILGKEVFDLFHHLNEELGITQSLLQNQDSQPNRRIFIRTAFALLEAFGCVIRSKAMEACMSKLSNHGKINVTEAAMLDDYSFDILENGDLKRKNKNSLPFKNHFAFSIKTLAQLYNVKQEYIPSQGWDYFGKAVLIRNRITHPKDSAHVQISDSDLFAVQEALRWAFNSVVDVFAKTPLEMRTRDKNSEISPQNIR